MDEKILARRSKIASELGSLGGHARVKKYGKKDMKRISILAVEARRKNHERSEK